MMTRWAKLSLRLLGARFGYLPKPLKVTFSVTKECHSKCLNCSIWKVRPEGELTLEEIQRFAKNSAYLSWIQFTGGEPTDRADFPEIVRAFYESCPDLLLVSFPTNGLKTKRIVEQAKRIAEMRGPQFVVTVSVDGPPEVNDRLRGIPGDFRKAVETYRALSEIPELRVYFGMTLYNENYRLIRETVAALAKEIPGFSEAELHVNLPHTSTHYYENEESAPQASLEMVKELGAHLERRGFSFEPFRVLERMYQRRAVAYVESGRTPEDCVALWASCFLSERGEVYPCIIWDQPLGNIREHDYSVLPILSGEKAAKSREQIREKNCPNCWTPCEAYQTLLIKAP